MTITSPPDEDALTASALDGDEQALGRLLAIHQQAAYNIAYRVLGSEADARDAVQDAFLQTVRAIRGDAAPPREGDRFRSWLRRVVTNAALGQLRRRPAFRPVPVDESAEALPAPERTEPAREAERRETRGDILLALLSLPDAQRASLALRDSEGFSYDEIAAILGVSRSAVETLLFRARRGFRAAYEGLAATPAPVGCRELAPLLAAAADGELSAAAWQDLQVHLDDCPDCRREIEGLRRTRPLLAAIPLLALPAGWDPVAAALEAAAAGAAGSVGSAGTAAAGQAGGATAPSVGGSATGAVGAATTGKSATTVAAAAGASATKVAGGGVLATLTGVTGAKAAAAAVVAAAGIGLATVAARLPASDAGPAASPTAAAPAVPPPAGSAAPLTRP